MFTHQRQETDRQLLEGKCADLERRRNTLPFRVQELAAQRVLRRVRDRMHESVEAIPSLASLFSRGFDVIRFGDVHLEDFGHRVELLRRHLRDAHHPAEAREQKLAARFLHLHGDRVTDASPIAHAGDQNSLACQYHG